MAVVGGGYGGIAAAKALDQIWFRCYGTEPVTACLAGGLQDARQADSRLRVTSQLQLEGHPTVFAIGDITAIPKDKRAQAAQVKGNDQLACPRQGRSPRTRHFARTATLPP